MLWHISFLSDTKVRVPKRFLTFGHLVHYKEDQNKMFGQLSISKDFGMQIEDVTDFFVSAELFFTYHNVVRNIQVGLVEADPACCRQTDKLTFCAESGWVSDRLVLDALFVTPFVEGDVFWLLRDFIGHLPIYLRHVIES